MINKRFLIKAAVYTSVILFLLMLGLYVYGSKAEERYPDYSSYSSRPNGAKALYILSGQMGYSVSRFERPSRFLPEKVTLIAVKPEIETLKNSLETKYLKEWLERGNTMVLLDDSSRLNKLNLEALGAKYIRDAGKRGIASEYDVADGKLYFIDEVDKYTNNGLHKLEPAVEFIGLMDLAGNRKLLFNEYFHGMGTRGTTVFDLLGLSGMLVLLQLLLALFIYFYIRSRRFGKPKLVFETLKRQENENLFALSSIYLKSKAYALVLETYMDYFNKQLSKFLGYAQIPDTDELYAAIAANGFLDKLNLKSIYNDCLCYIHENKKDGKQLLQLINRLERIRKEIR